MLTFFAGRHRKETLCRNAALFHLPNTRLEYIIIMIEKAMKKAGIFIIMRKLFSESKIFQVVTDILVKFFVYSTARNRLTF